MPDLWNRAARTGESPSRFGPATASCTRSDKKSIRRSGGSCRRSYSRTRRASCDGAKRTTRGSSIRWSALESGERAVTSLPEQDRTPSLLEISCAPDFFGEVRRVIDGIAARGDEIELGDRLRDAIVVLGADASYFMTYVREDR